MVYLYTITATKNRAIAAEAAVSQGGALSMLWSPLTDVADGKNQMV